MPLHMLAAFCLQHHFSIKSSFIRFWSTKALVNCHLKPVLRFPSPYSYAEVRAEKRRELGIEESQPEMTVEKVTLSQEDLWNAYCTELIRHHTFTAIPGFGLRVPAQHLQPEGGSGPLQPQSDTFGVISQLTQILSHRCVRPHLWVCRRVRKPRLRFSTAVHRASLSLPASQMKIQGDRSTPGRQSVSAVEMTSQRRSSISSQVGQRKLSHRSSSLKCSSFFLFILSSAVNELPKHRPEYGTHHDYPTAAAATGATASSEQRPSKTRIWLLTRKFKREKMECFLMALG